MRHPTPAELEVKTCLHARPASRYSTPSKRLRLPNSGLRLLQIMLRLPRTQTHLGAVLLSSTALVCAFSGFAPSAHCSSRSAELIQSSSHSCILLLSIAPPPSLARVQVCCHPHSYRCHPRTYTFRPSTLHASTDWLRSRLTHTEVGVTLVSAVVLRLVILFSLWLSFFF